MYTSDCHGGISNLSYNIDKQKHTVLKLVRYTKKTKPRKGIVNKKTFLNKVGKFSTA